MAVTRTTSLSAAALCAAAALAGCGSAATPTLAPTSPASTTPAESASPGSSPQANASLAIALTVGELPPSLSGYTQKSDGLLATTQNTDARVFASADGQTLVEIDLAVDASPTAASSDYTAYSAAASKQVQAQSSSSPGIGAQSNEFVGNDTSNRSSVALSFVEGSVIGVITMVSGNSTVSPKVVEAIATAEVQRIDAAGL